MENIVITYDNVLKSFNQDKKILSVSYEHKDRKVCFHSNQREILYSIRDYFKSVLKKDFTTYTETSYIKKLTICYFTIPHNPKKDKIIELYKQNYFHCSKKHLFYYHFHLLKKILVSLDHQNYSVHLVSLDLFQFYLF